MKREYVIDQTMQPKVLNCFPQHLCNRNDKLLAARKILTDSRVPQTTQLLRLLRDKSPASKRLAIFMIGKFRMTDMLSEVSECLNVPVLESHAVNVLKSFGSEGDEEMRRFYLLSSGNVQISKTILRIAGRERHR